jgi:hypothetical protein
MDGGNTFQQARSLGTAVLGNGGSPTIRVADTLEAGASAEWYRFRIRGRASSSMKPLATFAATEFVNRMQVFRSVNNRPKQSVIRLDTVNSQVQRSLPQGTYFIKISAPSASTGSQFATFAAQINLFG